jgi:hypothetical protein
MSGAGLSSGFLPDKRLPVQHHETQRRARPILIEVLHMHDAPEQAISNSCSKLDTIKT